MKSSLNVVSSARSLSRIIVKVSPYSDTKIVTRE